MSGYTIIYFAHNKYLSCRNLLDEVQEMAKCFNIGLIVVNCNPSSRENRISDAVEDRVKVERLMKKYHVKSFPHITLLRDSKLVRVNIRELIQYDSSQFPWNLASGEPFRFV